MMKLVWRSHPRGAQLSENTSYCRAFVHAPKSSGLVAWDPMPVVYNTTFTAAQLTLRSRRRESRTVLENGSVLGKDIPDLRGTVNKRFAMS